MYLEDMWSYLYLHVLLLYLLLQFGSGCVPVRLVEVCKEPGYIFVQIIGKGTRKLEQLLNDINEYYKVRLSKPRPPQLINYFYANSVHYYY